MRAYRHEDLPETFQEDEPPFQTVNASPDTQFKR